MCTHRSDARDAGSGVNVEAAHWDRPRPRSESYLACFSPPGTPPRPGANDSPACAAANRGRKSSLEEVDDRVDGLIRCTQVRTVARGLQHDECAVRYRSVDE